MGKCPPPPFEGYLITFARLRMHLSAHSLVIHQGEGVGQGWVRPHVHQRRLGVHREAHVSQPHPVANPNLACRWRHFVNASVAGEVGPAKVTTCTGSADIRQDCRRANGNSI